MKMSSTINEGAEYNDLRGLVHRTVSIDQYKSKVGKDNNIVVIAFKIMEKHPANDVVQFLESGFESYDVDVSPGPDGDGMYTVFVEVDRNHKLYEIVESMITQLKNLDNEFENVMFTSYEHKMPQDFSKENFENSVISDSYEYTIKHNPEAKKLEERIKFLKDY